MAKTRRPRDVATALAVVVALAACGLAFKRPTVHVADVRLASLGLTGGTVAVTVQVDNPNHYDLESKAFAFSVAFRSDSSEAWSTLAQGSHDTPEKFVGGDTTSVELEVPFDVASVGAALSRLLRRGELEYRFTGELRVGTPVGTTRVPFDQTGLFRP